MFDFLKFPAARSDNGMGERRPGAGRYRWLEWTGR